MPISTKSDDPLGLEVEPRICEDIQILIYRNTYYLHRRTETSASPVLY